MTDSAPSEVRLQLDGAGHHYRAGRRIGPITFTAGVGQVVGLVGANGSGKTTTFRMITGLATIDSGTVTVDGTGVRYGFLPTATTAMIEEPAFYDWASGRDNLRLAAGGRADRNDRIGAVLQEVGLSGAADDLVKRYSQGMRQRLGLARILLHDARLILLDEPTNGLDPEGMRWLRELLRSLAGRGVTILVSSHLLHELEQIADTLVVLSHGKVLLAGDAAAICASSDSLESLYLRLVDSDRG
ncbi:ABC transporter ATP-binding protein [Krasilnikovia sp. M28-CT-15]|uniref:ABC transporter ATP-binding protein n=1 Tax=Krasilnikovia sp. M28-CT-15 TaxID=3373540 RepID=UPI0038762AD9